MHMLKISSVLLLFELICVGYNHVLHFFIFCCFRLLKLQLKRSVNGLVRLSPLAIGEYFMEI